MSGVSRLVLLFSLFGAVAHAELKLDKIKLPPGFAIEVYASGVKNSRSMAWGEGGKTLFVGTRTEGKVYAITPDKKIHVLAKGLTMPNGVAFRNGSLYVAEVSRILRFDVEPWLAKTAEGKLAAPPEPVVLVDNFPKDLHHGWKYLAFGPDDQLYVPVGAPCNVCDKAEPYASILRVSPDGKTRASVARGVRNSVGFDWHPQTKELWFTDNGRDMLSDDTPGDELNRVRALNAHYGYPYCHAGSILDPEFGKGKRCEDYVPPAQVLGAHVAALGMKFYTGKMFPKEYVNQVILAEHGSWNRSGKVGYRLTLVKLDAEGKSSGTTTFAEGWLQGESAWGRPVDVIVAADGALLVSDDEADAIYRISYKKP